MVIRKRCADGQTGESLHPDSDYFASSNSDDNRGELLIGGAADRLRPRRLRKEKRNRLPGNKLSPRGHRAQDFAVCRAEFTAAALRAAQNSTIAGLTAGALAS